MSEAPVKKPPTCGNCPYYEGNKVTGSKDTGVCRKNAPRHSTASFYLWPEVRGIDWWSTSGYRVSGAAENGSNAGQRWG